MNRNLIFLPLSFIFLLTSCSSSKSLKVETKSTFSQFPAFQSGFSGFALFNPETEEMLIEHNPDKYFTPASNTKLFTFYTGLKTLADSVPALKYVVKNDSLIFWGTANPAFLHPEYGNNEVYNFLKEREEKLFYLPPKNKIEHFGPGWAWDDYNWYYSVERNAFPVYGNYVTFTFKPEKEIPEVKPSFFRSKIIADSTLPRNSSLVVRDLNKNIFRYQYSEENEDDSQDVPFIASPQLVVKLLQDTLNKPVELLEDFTVSSRTVQTFYGIATDSLYKRMLQVSDNFLAEQILLMSAGAISDTLNAEIAIDYMMENHLQDLPDEPDWVDGSGLSVYNKFTPRAMVKLLSKIREEVPQERLFKLLPAGGESGTIKNLYKADEPYIYAKTGTLSNTHNLSGYLKTKKGKVLIFSFMNNNYMAPTSEVKKGMEKILRNIYLNY